MRRSGLILLNKPLQRPVGLMKPGGNSRRNSIAGQRFMTTVTPWARARRAASSLITPTCIQITRGRGSSRSASSTTSPAAAELRNTSTISIGAGTSAIRALTGRPRISAPAWKGLTGKVSKPRSIRTPRTSLDGRAGLGEAPTTAIVRTLVRIWRIASSPRPSTEGMSVVPMRLALLEEGADSFDGVRLGQIVDHRLGGERLLDLLVEGALADGERRGGAAGDLSRESLGLRQRPALGNHPVDEPEPLRLGGAVELSGERHLHRALARYGPADCDQGRRAEEADVDARQGEAGGLAGDRQIARRDELASRRRGDAFHSRDDRLRQRDDRLHERSAAGHDVLVEGAPPVGVVAVSLDLPEVVAGAERRPFAGDHDGARLAVLGEVGEGDDQRIDHRKAEGVAVLRRGQGQRDDAGIVLAAEEGRGSGGGGRAHGGGVLEEEPSR